MRPSDLADRNLVEQMLKRKNLDDSFRTFMIPGMDHCAGGNAAYSFGGPSQAANVNGGQGASLKSQPRYDVR